MTPHQALALQLLITADRTYRRRAERSLKGCGPPADPDDRGVEIWAHGDISPSTAASLVRAGVAEISASGINRGKWLFLGSAAPLDAPSSR